MGGMTAVVVNTRERMEGEKGKREKRRKDVRRQVIVITVRGRNERL